MKIVFIGDLHLDHSFPHSIAAGRERFKEKQLSIIRTLVGLPDTKFVYLGDIFDKFNVTIETFCDALTLLASHEDHYLLAGNHDFSKNSDKLGSLQRLGRLHTTAASVIVRPETIVLEGQGMTISFVPHLLTQELFDQEIRRLCNNTRVQAIKTNVLVLHCNYGNWDGKSFENYLTADQHKALSEIFDLIVSGHQHGVSVHNIPGHAAAGSGPLPLGSLVYPGSILPMNFGEMTRKYAVVFDCDSHRASLVPLDEVTSPAGFQHYTLDAKEFLSDDFSAEDISHGTPVDFLTITGEISPSENIALTKEVQKFLHSNPHIIACNNSCTVVTVNNTDDNPSEIIQAAKLTWQEAVMAKLGQEAQSLFTNRLNG